MTRIYNPLDRLKGRLCERRITYRDLAKALNLAAATVSNKINGYYSFSLEEAVNLSHMLDISEAEFGEYFFVKKVTNRNDAGSKARRSRPA